MDTPVYHLDGVVHAKSERENFDGPLDLILNLLSKNKMEIEEIQISLILDQYLEWMNQQQELNLEVASEFVAMAAHLVYIKTRMLLSIQDEEAASEMEELIASLEARRRSENYGKICQVTTLLSGRYEMGCDYITKPPEVLKPSETYQYRHQPGEMCIRERSHSHAACAAADSTTPVLLSTGVRQHKFHHRQDLPAAPAQRAHHSLGHGQP